jgi:hypothetical protein
MNNKRALVLGQGGLAGAYSAGFASELCRKLGNIYFIQYIVIQLVQLLEHFLLPISHKS